jgi:DNA-binding beta-propeller fold protein YncE
MHRRSLFLLAMASALAAFAPLGVHASEAGRLQVVQRMDGPDGGWDYSSYDPERRRIYITHDKVVLELDLADGKLNTSFASGDHMREVVVVPDHDLLVTTNAGDSTAKILRASDGELLKSLAVAADPDGAAYDPATGLVVVIGGDPGVLTLIDPVKQETVGTIVVGNQLEFGAADGRGRFFVNVVDRGQVAVVDLKSRKVLRRYALRGCSRPTGLAYVEGGRLISSCDGLAKILRADNGKEIASLRIGGYPDAVLYDPGRRLAYIPTGLDGKLWTIALSGKNANRIVDAVRTQIGARSGAVDPKTGRIYLPTAEYGPIQPGQRPRPKPDTFQILVLDRR